MKIYLLSAGITFPDWIKSYDAIVANGHSVVGDVGDADLILIGPDVKADIALISLKERKVGRFINYNNWLARTFESY